MRLEHDEALARLTAHDHGVLSTLHADRGMDAVPVVFAVHEDHIGVPVDLVKPKTSLHLQRERNLDADQRATLLVDHWDRDDWSQLWWVRAELRRISSSEREDAIADALAAKYPQYADRPFDRVLVFHIAHVTGWTASATRP